MRYFENFIDYPIQAAPWNVIRIHLNQQANVRLLDESNYQKYRTGQNYHYYGGLAQISPVDLRVPHVGSWHVVIDLGGYSGVVQSSVEVI